ncbi:MAG: glycosyltransferase family 4 protein, partial [Romboutsia sp.]|nr:glycosyltransferase family 4 protein [Romboutsia sp.]
NKNIKHIHIQKNDKIGFNIVYHLKEVIRRENFDVVISYLDTPNFYTSLSMLFIRNKPKFICSYRSKSDFGKMGFFELNMKKWVNNRADYIVSNSFHEAQRWANQQKHISNKIKTIYNAVDTSRIFPILDLNKLNYFLVVGSISEAKNGLLVIKAIAYLKSIGISIKLHWVGEKQYSIKKRANYIDLMEKEIIKANIQDNWTWLEPSHNINEIFNRAKALILASTIEGLPNVVCEALATGLPCIVSNVLDHSISVNDGYNGYLFDPYSYKSLAASLQSLYTLNDIEYLTLSTNAVSVANSLFNIDKIVNSYENLMC